MRAHEADLRQYRVVIIVLAGALYSFGFWTAIKEFTWQWSIWGLEIMIVDDYYDACSWKNFSL